MEGPGETGPVYPKRGTRGFPGRLPQVGQRAKQEGNQPIPSAAWLQKCKSRNPERRHHPLQRSESWKVEEISKCPLRFSCRARHFQDSKGTRTWRRSKGTIQFRVITACLSQVKDKHEPGAGGGHVETWGDWRAQSRPGRPALSPRTLPYATLPTELYLFNKLIL